MSKKVYVEGHFSATFVSMLRRSKIRNFTFLAKRENEELNEEDFLVQIVTMGEGVKKIEDNKYNVYFLPEGDPQKGVNKLRTLARKFLTLLLEEEVFSHEEGRINQESK